MTSTELDPKVHAEVERQMEALRLGVVDLQTEENLRSKITKSVQSGTPLRVKYGADPSAPDLHLGHTVGLMKLRQFQDLGHTVIFLIGDFTARIGDPTGKKETRPMLTEEEIAANAETYKAQVFKVLNPERTEIRFNNEWMTKLTSIDMVRLTAQMTVARMLERDDFSKRFKGGQAIGIHEFLYPLIQGYDSVALEADVELGGTDQLFNLLVGRELQRHHGQTPQVVMTMPLLEGTDASLVDGAIVGQKMSKSLGNYVGIAEDPNQQFGKMMSISDPVMWRYYALVSGLNSTEVAQIRSAVDAGTTHPMDAKKSLARRIVKLYHGEEASLAAQQDFETRFSQREIPEDIPVVEVQSGDDNTIGLAQLLRAANLSSSGKEARRSCEQGAVKIDGEKSSDPNLRLEAGADLVVQVGRRKIAQVKIT
jgi:tyrosyl-tRNA synthetase